MTETLKVAGIVGGAGATVLSKLMHNAEDAGQDLSEASFVVGRNDYRTAKALVENMGTINRPCVCVVIVAEPGRALDKRDFKNLVGNIPLVWLEHADWVARADDAGLLEDPSFRLAKKAEYLQDFPDW